MFLPTAEHFQIWTMAQKPFHIFPNTENLACLLKTQFFTEKKSFFSINIHMMMYHI